MNKWFSFILAALLLCGCSAQPVFETVEDVDVLPASATVRQIKLDLPKEAAKPVMQSEDGDSLYLCDGYTLTVQTLSGGDLDRTFRQVTGHSHSQLQPIRSKSGDAARYDVAWTAAGEGDDQVARAVILDDGFYHYAVSVMADAQIAGSLQNQWKTVLGSVSLRTD